MISPDWRCRDCGRDAFTASVKDPARCSRCAAARYIWRPASFGRTRLVPPLEVARWNTTA